MWNCELDAIRLWEAGDDEMTAWSVDDFGNRLVEITAVDGDDGEEGYNCTNCSLWWMSWGEVLEHLKDDEKEDGQRGKWKHHG